MSSVEISDNYFKLAKLKGLLESKIKLTKDMVNMFLECGYKLNYQLSSNQLNEHYNTKWIGYTVLHFIAENKRTYDFNNEHIFLKSILNLGADITCKDNKGFTPVRLAYEVQAHKTFINIMLSIHRKFYITLNPSCNDGISHFHIACKIQNIDVVTFFLNAGISVNEAIKKTASKHAGCTPLHIAVENEDKEMIQLLMNHGADSNYLNANGISPKHMLIKSQIQYIAYPEINLNRYKKIMKNESLLSIVIKSNESTLNKVDHIGLTEFHIYCTINKNFNIDEFKIALKYVININATINSDSPVWPGYTPLHFAAHCNLNIVKLLLINGANLMAKDTNGKTPLDICFDKYEPCKISNILSFQPDLASIKFVNDDYLIHVIKAYNSEEGLKNYLNNTDVNNTIPINSPLWPGFTLLHVAVCLSPGIDRSKVSLCLQYGADIMIQDVNKMTALHLAFRMERKRCVRNILEAHKEKFNNPVDVKNLSHFHIACAACNNNNIKMVKHFLSCGVNLNDPIQSDVGLNCDVTISFPFLSVKIPAGSTPLHIAVAIKNDLLLKTLLKHATNSRCIDTDGFTWIHRAFVGKYFEKFKSFIHNEDFQAINHKAPGKLSHFHIACYTGNLKSVERLLQLSDISEPINSDITKYIEKLPFHICLGDTPLHFAVKSLSEEVVDLLLKNKADVQIRNELGLSPLHIALLNYSLFNKKSQAIINHLILKYDKDKKWPDDIGLTKLHVACILDDLPLIIKLINSGEDVFSRIKVDSRIWPNFTPLCFLIDKEEKVNSEAVKFLLNHIAKNMKVLTSVRGKSSGKLQGYKRLKLDKKRIVTNKGLTPFHLSCMGNDSSIVETFIKSGVDINEPNNHFAVENAGYTSIHFAVKYGSESVLEMLLKYKADISIEDSMGFTPIYLATMECPQKIETFVRWTTIEIGNKNIFGMTLIDVLLNNSKAENDFYLNILKNGTGIEKLEANSHKCLVQVLLDKFCSHMFKNIIEYVPKISLLDDKKCNALHYFAMNTSPVSYDQSLKLHENIELLIKKGCDLDQQDVTGRTPLFYSIISDIDIRVEVLLSLGADINIPDKKKKTPYSHVMSITSKCYSYQNLFNNYVGKLKSAGLYLNPINEECFRSYENSAFMNENSNILKIMDTITFFDFFSWRFFLTEEMVKKFPAMPMYQREKIIDILKVEEVWNAPPLAIDWLPIFRLQYRKVVKRQILFDNAFDIFYNKIYPLPSICLEFILVNLDNKDLITFASAYS